MSRIKIKILFIIIVANILTVNKILCRDYYITHGNIMPYETIKKAEKCFNKIEKCFNKTEFSEKFGHPACVIKSENYDIWLYYFLDNTSNITDRLITKYMSVIFENKEEKFQSIFFFD